MQFFKSLAKRSSGLRDKLRQAGIADEPETYIKKTFMTAIMMSFGMAFFLAIIIKPILAVSFIILVPIFYSYYLRYVDMKIILIKKKIDEEIIFAGRFLIIELESGVPITKAFENLEKNYEYVGAYFGDIINKAYLGTTLEDAINDTIINTPSPNLRKILWQVLNSLKTGADIGPALNSVIDQIVKEQQIAVKDYGKKLNPFAMFYLMVSVIVPSLGTTMIVVVATFMDLSIKLPFLLALAGFIGFIQFMFMSIVKSTRPPISTQ